MDVTLASVLGLVLACLGVLALGILERHYTARERADMLDRIMARDLAEYTAWTGATRAEAGAGGDTEQTRPNEDGYIVN